jgi:hypothetical protein
MQEDELKMKEPIEMTSDELLDYVIHPDVAEKLKARTREQEPCEPEETD